MSPTERDNSRRSLDVCRAVPTHHKRLNLFSIAGPVGVMSSSISRNTFSSQVNHQSVSSALDCQDVQRSPPSTSLLDAQASQTTQLDSFPLSIPTHLEDCGRPTAVLGSSRQKGIGSEVGTSSSRTALRSLPSRFCTSAVQGTSMRARRRQRDPVPQSSTVTSTRSDLAAKTFSDDLPITTSRSRGVPLSYIPNLHDVSSARKDAKTQAVKRIPKSIPRPPPSRLVPEFLDQTFIQSDEASLDEDDPPCASGMAQKGHSPNYRVSSRPRNTPSPDCFLPGDSGERVRLRIIAAFADIILVVSSSGCAALEGQGHDFEDFVFFIPPDCPTSTPVASRKQASSWKRQE